jgi:hypothetical protein
MNARSSNGAAVHELQAISSHLVPDPTIGVLASLILRLMGRSLAHS